MFLFHCMFAYFIDYCVSLESYVVCFVLENTFSLGDVEQLIAWPIPFRHSLRTKVICKHSSQLRSLFVNKIVMGVACW